MKNYEFTISSREDFEAAELELINDFTSQVINAEVTADWRSPHNGRIISCKQTNPGLNHLIIEVYFDDTDETKLYNIATGVNSGSLLFIDDSLKELWDSLMEVHINLNHQLNVVLEEARCREKEEQKLEKKRKENEKKMAGMKAQAEKEMDSLVHDRTRGNKPEEFFWTLGWLAKHVGTITAKMPDYLEETFVKYFGDVEHTAVDSTKVGPAGYTSQWRLSMEASLVKAKSIPATLTQYLNPTGKKLSKTSFIWELVDDYGFKFGKKQDVVDIMRCVPIEYVPTFNAGMEA